MVILPHWRVGNPDLYFTEGIVTRRVTTGTGDFADIDLGGGRTVTLQTCCLDRVAP